MFNGKLKRKIDSLESVVDNLINIVEKYNCDNKKLKQEIDRIERLIGYCDKPYIAFHNYCLDTNSNVPGCYIYFNNFEYKVPKLSLKNPKFDTNDCKCIFIEDTYEEYDFDTGFEVTTNYVVELNKFDDCKFFVTNKKRTKKQA